MLARISHVDIISGMRRLGTDDLVRIVGGLALLALLVVQENIWPELLTPPPKPEARDTDPADSGTPPTDGSKTDGAPHSFKLALPDIGPARWMAGVDAMPGAEIGGRFAGVYACGPLTPPKPIPALPAFVPPWQIGTPSVPPLVLGKPDPANTLSIAPDPALRTVVTRTGPPLA